MQVNRIQSNIYSNRPNFNGLGGADKIAKALESQTTKVVSQNSDGKIIEDFYDFNGKKTKTIVKNSRGETYEEYYDSDGKEIKSVLKDPKGYVTEIGEKIYDFKNRLVRSILKGANGRLIFDTEFVYGRDSSDIPTEMTIKGANGKILSRHA